MRKTLLPRIFTIFVISALTILFFACSDELEIPEQQNKTAVSFSVTGNLARTVFPQVDLSYVDHYELLGEINNKAGEESLGVFNGSGLLYGWDNTVMLEVGTWNFTLNAYNSSGKHILQGKVQNKEITMTGLNQVSFSLSAIRNGTGSIEITLDFPSSARLTNIISTNISSNGDVDVDEFILDDYAYSFVYTKNNIEAGDYIINFELYAGDLLKAVVSELVLVRNNLTSSKTIYLAGENLKPLPTFEITIDPNIIGTDEWELTAQTAQAVPNENTLFTVTGTYAEYQWYLDGESAANSSEYNFCEPAGVYELVVVVTNSNGESRSGRCRVTVSVNTPAVYKVIFDVNGGSGTAPPARLVNTGSNIIIPGGSGLTRSGYTFGGWNTNSAGTGTNYLAGSSYTPAGNTTLYAKWTTACTVEFRNNGGSGTVPTRTVNLGTSIAIPDGNTLSRTNYAFGGWNTSNDGSGTNYDPSSLYTVTGNSIFYAKWNVTAYTVSFNLNSGSGTAPSSQTVTVGSNITALPAGTGITRSGYVFGGWNTLADGTGTNYNAGASYTPAGNTQTITLYVKWIVAYTVTFNTNGSGGTVSSQTVGSGSSIATLPSTTWTDYVFDGWNTSANGTGTSYAAGSSFTPTGNITLYAQWYIFKEDFEGTNSFTIVNGSEPNKWHVGTATKYEGTKSAYISNDGGISNAYTSTSYSGVHMYRNVKFPSSGTYTLTFYWKSMGTKYSTNYFDYLAVSLIETSSTPSAGLEVIPTSTLARYASDYGTVPGWNSATVSITISEQYGTTKRLVFSWINTNNATNDQPPAAVDNIVVKR